MVWTYFFLLQLTSAAFGYCMFGIDYSSAFTWVHEVDFFLESGKLLCIDLLDAHIALVMVIWTHFFDWFGEHILKFRIIRTLSIVTLIIVLLYTLVILIISRLMSIDILEMTECISFLSLLEREM